MTSFKPYLLRACYEWLAENGEKPLLTVDAEYPGVQVPQHAVKDGRITLNVAMSAVRDLEMGNEAISFGARFNGQPHGIYLPIASILGVGSEQAGAVMAFEPERSPASESQEDLSDETDEPPKPRPGGPGLRVVK